MKGISFREGTSNRRSGIFSTNVDYVTNEIRRLANTTQLRLPCNTCGWFKGRSATAEGQTLCMTRECRVPVQFTRGIFLHGIVKGVTEYVLLTLDQEVTRHTRTENIFATSTVERQNTIYSVDEDGREKSDSREGKCREGTCGGVAERWDYLVLLILRFAEYAAS